MKLTHTSMYMYIYIYIHYRTPENLDPLASRPRPSPTLRCASLPLAFFFFLAGAAAAAGAVLAAAGA